MSPPRRVPRPAARSALPRAAPTGTGALLAAVVLAGSPAPARPGDDATATGTLRLRVREAGRGRGDILPCRAHLEDPDGEAVRAPGLPFFRGRLAWDGSLDLGLAPGTCRRTVARGPEHREAHGTVEVEAGRAAGVDVPLERRIDERIARVEASTAQLAPEERSAVLEPHREARVVFDGLIGEAEARRRGQGGDATDGGAGDEGGTGTGETARPRAGAPRGKPPGEDPGER